MKGLITWLPVNTPRFSSGPSADCRSTSVSVMYPYPPWICTASRCVRTLASLTNTLATAASSDASMPWSISHPTLRTSAREASTATFMFAILSATDSYFPMGLPDWRRDRA